MIFHSFHQWTKVYVFDNGLNIKSGTANKNWNVSICIDFFHSFFCHLLKFYNMEFLYVLQKINGQYLIQLNILLQHGWDLPTMKTMFLMEHWMDGCENIKQVESKLLILKNFVAEIDSRLFIQVNLYQK